MTAPGMAALIDQGAARTREACATLGINLRDPAIVRALHLLTTDIHVAMRTAESEVDRGVRTMLVIDYWLTAIQGANEL